MSVILIGDVPGEYRNVLLKLGFEISEKTPQERNAVLLFYENCREAERLGYGCLTKDELEELLSAYLSEAHSV
ncbi:hypothetical protein [Pyrobaculum ferrireducens]|uniref:hypothetical protein n=1 Tax=Pyrobaculum ferrireducens TaxID=1104324 RepID=UPI000AF7A1AC|nr:hypothetical protein [Pyrobaculum ferrireducens]